MEKEGAILGFNVLPSERGELQKIFVYAYASPAQTPEVFLHLKECIEKRTSVRQLEARYPHELKNLRALCKVLGEPESLETYGDIHFEDHFRRWCFIVHAHDRVPAKT